MQNNRHFIQQSYFLVAHAKVRTLDFTLLLVFTTFTVIHVNKKIIFSHKWSCTNGARHQTILKFPFWNSTRNQKTPLVLNTQTSINRINKVWKNSKDSIALRVELCKDKIGSSPLQIEMCKPLCSTCFL